MPAARSLRQLALSYWKRLHYPREFRRFFDRSEIFRLSECVIFRVANDLGHFRLGITMKARGSSVDRNRVKRAIREGVRVHAPQLGSYDYNVVVPGSKRLGRLYAERLARCLGEELPRALRRQ